MTSLDDIFVFTRGMPDEPPQKSADVITSHDITSTLSTSYRRYVFYEIIILRLYTLERMLYSICVRFEY